MHGCTCSFAGATFAGAIDDTSNQITEAKVARAVRIAATSTRTRKCVVVFMGLLQAGAAHEVIDHFGPSISIRDLPQWRGMLMGEETAHRRQKARSTHLRVPLAREGPLKRLLRAQDFEVGFLSKRADDRPLLDPNRTYAASGHKRQEFMRTDRFQMRN